MEEVREGKPHDFQMDKVRVRGPWHMKHHVMPKDAGKGRGSEFGARVGVRRVWREWGFLAWGAEEMKRERHRGNRSSLSLTM